MGHGANIELIRAGQLISVMVGVRNQNQSVPSALLLTYQLIRKLSLTVQKSGHFNTRIIYKERTLCQKKKSVMLLSIKTR